MASVAVIGEVNLDLIVLGAGRFPRPGEELIVDRMVVKRTAKRRGGAP